MGGRLGGKLYGGVQPVQKYFFRWEKSYIIYKKPAAKMLVYIPARM